MNTPLVERLVLALLYEGYILYPYRASSKKNQQRFTFGRVYPEVYSRSQNGVEPCRMQTECLVSEISQAELTVRVRFLQPIWREILTRTSEGKNFAVVPEIRRANERLLTWQEAIERQIDLPAAEPRLLSESPHVVEFAFPASEQIANHPDDDSIRIRLRNDPLQGTVELTAEAVGCNLWKLRICVVNTTSVAESFLNDQDAIVMRTCASTHTVLTVTGGEFVSLLEPPDTLREIALACKNIGTWPVLVGDEKACERNVLLSSPIILYDYPKVATESPGDLFDGTEIDEILSLRILAMSEEEKLEMRQVDDHARRILERTEALAEESWLGMHGMMRETAQQAFFERDPKLEGVTIGQVSLKPGDRVRIRSKRRADAMDLILNGKIAAIEAIEQAVDGQVHLALVLDDDPGKDLGLIRQPGHRFFYLVDEVEPLERGEPCAS